MSAAADGLISALENNFTTIDLALQDLSDEEFHRIPAPDCNSVAWTLWHLSRVMDSFIHTRLRDLPQLWDANSWEQHYGMPAGGENRGLGWTHQMVCDWQPPSRALQMDYFEQVRTALREYLPSLTDAQMQQAKIIPPVSEPRTVAAALGQMTWDCVSHGGQIAFLRGMYKGMGWHR